MPACDGWEQARDEGLWGRRSAPVPERVHACYVRTSLPSRVPALARMAGHGHVFRTRPRLSDAGAVRVHRERVTDALAADAHGNRAATGAMRPAVLAQRREERPCCVQARALTLGEPLRRWRD